MRKDLITKEKWKETSKLHLAIKPNYEYTLLLRLILSTSHSVFLGWF